MTQFLEPDFVVLGTQKSDGTVWLFASDKLSRAELQAEYETFLGYDICGSSYLMAINLTVVMREYVMVTGDTYQEAFQKLFRTWQPQAPKQTQIAPKRKEIDHT